jgi:thiamine biosynthesis protein ThiS
MSTATMDPSKVLQKNGSKYVLNSVMTICQLMDYLGFNQNVIVIDYNGTILEKSLWQQTYINYKDCLKILSIAGGG